MGKEKIRIIDHQTIMNLNIDSLTTIKWIEDVIKHKDRTVLPPKTHINLEDNVFYNVMPSVLLDQDVMGVKVVTRQPGRADNDQPGLTSQIMLYDLCTGHIKAVIDANFITAMRTGAIAAHSMSLFSRKDFKTVGMVGLGMTAITTMNAFVELQKEKHFSVKLLRYKNQAEQFAERYKDNKNASFEIVDSIEEICGCDIVVSCVTYKKDPFVPDACFAPGCTVVPVHTRGFQNCDLFFDKVFADDRGHVVDFQYFSKFKRFSEVADVMSGKTPGRESDQERIVVYNIGLSIHDIYFAKKIYEMVKDAPELNFAQPEKKLWL